MSATDTLRDNFAVPFITVVKTSGPGKCSDFKFRAALTRVSVVPLEGHFMSLVIP